jgi:hypothetical protein
MEPSDRASLHEVTRKLIVPAIHASGSCPYPVALRSSVLLLPSPREGEEEGKEGVTDAECVVEVAVAEEGDDDEPIEAISASEFPPRSAYKQMAWIQIVLRGRPTGTLAP